MRCQREVVTFSVNSSTVDVLFHFYDVDDNLKRTDIATKTSESDWGSP